MVKRTTHADSIRVRGQICLHYILSCIQPPRTIIQDKLFLNAFPPQKTIDIQPQDQTRARESVS